MTKGTDSVCLDEGHLMVNEAATGWHCTRCGQGTPLTADKPTLWKPEEGKTYTIRPTAAVCPGELFVACGRTIYRVDGVEVWFCPEHGRYHGA